MTVRARGAGVVDRVGDGLFDFLGEDFLQFLGDDAVAYGVGLVGSLGHGWLWWLVEVRGKMWVVVWSWAGLGIDWSDGIWIYGFVGCCECVMGKEN